jgi:creatinine amidohydrolase
MVDWGRISTLDPSGVRRELGEGSFGGLYQRSDDEMLSLWQTGVEETRAVIEAPWRA